MQTDKPDLKQAAPADDNRPSTRDGYEGSPLQSGIEKWYQEEWSPAPPGNPAPGTSRNCIAVSVLVLILLAALAVL
ncbi:MAG: hypothetical protein IBX71_10605 [Candidatus Desulforudis sp.]|nr:hypothetical protein [Desulforudis sp.]